MSTRRAFLEAAGSASALALLPRALRAATPVPAPEKIARIGLELYTVRTEMRKSVENTLSVVAKAGYQEVEFAGYFDRDPAALRAMLDADGLTAPSVHVDMSLLERGWRAQSDAAKAMGHRTLIVPSVDRSRLPAIDDWKLLAKRFNEIGRRAAGDGLRFGFHNHYGEFSLIAGTCPYDVLLGETDPALVDFQMDLYWALKAGADPLDYFARYPGRFKSVHVKDAGPKPALEMRDVGAGTIDWKRIFARHKQAGIEHYFVEHDEPADPVASITASARYLAALSY
jgi:sugar phosphate isomerase/epimerase